MIRDPGVAAPPIAVRALIGISIGGHIGGLVGGAICGALVIAGERGQLGSSAKAIEYGGMIAVGVISVIGAISVASPIPGITFALLRLPF